MSVYLSEVCPIQIRGSVVTIYIMCITIGLNIAYGVALACDGDWRLMLGIAGAPAAI